MLLKMVLNIRFFFFLINLIYRYKRQESNCHLFVEGFKSEIVHFHRIRILLQELISVAGQFS